MADQIVGKEPAVRDPATEQEILPKLLAFWDPLWLRSGGKTRGRLTGIDRKRVHWAFAYRSRYEPENIFWRTEIYARAKLWGGLIKSVPT